MSASIASLGRTARELPWLGGAVLACALAALVVPARWQAWAARPLGLASQVLVAPVAAPMRRVVAWARPVPAPPSDAVLGALEDQNAQLQTRVLQLQDENSRLRTLLEQQRILLGPAGGAAGVDQMPVPVIGSTSDGQGRTGGRLIIRAGERDGVEIGSVATVNFVHLLGRVVGAGPRTATVATITAAGGEPLTGVVIRGETGQTLLTQLSPVGDGTLRGLLEDKRDAENKPIVPQVGDVVRLSDASRWPGHAQMLIIGAVERVGPSPEQPLRSQVVVRPIVGELGRVGEVVLRLTPGLSAPSDGRGGGAR